MYFIVCALTSNWCEIPLYFFPHLNLRACRSKMALFKKTTYTICFISVSDACTWQAIKIEENFQKSPRPTLHPMGVLVKLTLFPTWGSGRNGPPYQEIICLYVFFPRSHSLHRYWWALLYTILSKHHFCPFYISLFFLRFYLGNGLHISLIDVRTNYNGYI